MTANEFQLPHMVVGVYPLATRSSCRCIKQTAVLVLPEGFTFDTSRLYQLAS
jgi:hypothetical protein